MVNENKKINIKKMLNKKKGLYPEKNIKITRSGLTIHDVDMKKKIKGMRPDIMEENKAKKDFMFRKALSTNCKVVLGDL